MAKKSGPKPMQFTEEQRAQVRRFALSGMTHEQIAKHYGLDDKTIAKYFKAELEAGHDIADSAVAGALFKNAMSGNVAAQIFWMKTRRRWRETGELQLLGKDGKELETIINITLSDEWKKREDEKG